jgi:hypothetical protein
MGIRKLERSANRLKRKFGLLRLAWASALAARLKRAAEKAARKAERQAARVDAEAKSRLEGER